jgi:hypothetical protein
MNKLSRSLSALLAVTSLCSAAFAADVGVSVNIAQPGFYGRIDIGQVPQPVVIYPQPVIIDQRGPVMLEPIYLRVPPGHERHWDKYCRHYNACGLPVYFVQDRWYRDVYAPHFHEGPDHHHEGHDPHWEDWHEHEHHHGHHHHDDFPG